MSTFNEDISDVDFPNTEIEDPNRVFSNPPYLGQQNCAELLDDEGEVIDVQAIGQERLDPVPDYELICLSDVVAKPVDWLWPKRIAQGSSQSLLVTPDWASQQSPWESPPRSQGAEIGRMIQDLFLNQDR